MLIYGASGHAKVIIDIIRSNSEEEKIEYIFDDNPEIKEILNFSVEHSWNENFDSIPAVIAVGNNSVRKKLASKINLIHTALIHSRAVISENYKVGTGSVIMAGAVVNSDVRIGEHCIINTGAVIEHDVEINNFAHISPGATVTGNVVIGEGTQIGAGATVIPGVNIGKWVTVGAGAVVIKDIPDYAVVVGNPARLIKYNNGGNE